MQKAILAFRSRLEGQKSTSCLWTLLQRTWQQPFWTQFFFFWTKCGSFRLLSVVQHFPFNVQACLRSFIPLFICSFLPSSPSFLSSLLPSFLHVLLCIVYGSSILHVDMYIACGAYMQWCRCMHAKTRAGCQLSSVTFLCIFSWDRAWLNQQPTGWGEAGWPTSLSSVYLLSWPCSLQQCWGHWYSTFVFSRRIEFYSNHISNCTIEQGFFFLAELN